MNAEHPDHDDGSALDYRLLWTWDHSTEWALNRPGAQTLGASNYYARAPEVFIEDYTALLGWCGRHGVDAVVVWGLLPKASRESVPSPSLRPTPASSF